MSWRTHQAGGTTTSICRPERVADIVAVLREVSAGHVGRGMIASGRPMPAAAALNPGGRVLLTGRLNCLLAFDPARGTVACEAGVTFGEIDTVFMRRGFSAPIPSAPSATTLGGAVAADVFGPTHACHGSMSDHVQWLDVALPGGEIVHASRAANQDIFRATLGGLGLTGVIVRVGFKLVATTGGGARMTTVPVTELAPALRALGSASEAALPIATCLRLDRIEPAGGRVAGALSTVHFDVDAEGRGIGPSPGMTEFLRSACSFAPNRHLPWPRTTSRLRGVLPSDIDAAGIERLAASGAIPGASAAQLLLFPVARDAVGDLSLAVRGLGFELAQSGPKFLATRGLHAALARVHRCVLDLGGRTELDCDQALSRDDLARSRPRLAAFSAVRRRIDPRADLQSATARRLGLAETAE